MVALPTDANEENRSMSYVFWEKKVIVVPRNTNISNDLRKRIWKNVALIVFSNFWSLIRDDSYYGALRTSQI